MLIFIYCDWGRQRWVGSPWTWAVARQYEGLEVSSDTDTHAYTHTHMYIHCICVCVCDIFIQKWNAHNNIHVYNFTEIYAYTCTTLIRYWTPDLDMSASWGIHQSFVYCAIMKLLRAFLQQVRGCRLTYGVFSLPPQVRDAHSRRQINYITSLLPGAPRQRNGTDAFQW